MKKNNYIFLIIILALALYSPSIFNYFSSDDWFHLRISQITSVDQFLNFFSFVKNDQSAAFYRPLSTQVYFYVFYQFFGLIPLPYYLVTLITYVGSLWLIYRLGQLLFKNPRISLITVLIYAFSATHFTRIYFLSAFQEVLMTFFVLLSIYLFLTGQSYFKKYCLSLFCFIVALLSKETAIVLPLLLAGLGYLKDRKITTALIPFMVIGVVYLGFRIFVFGLADGDSYSWNFAPKSALNTLFWYTLWSLGTPEFLVDYIGSGLRVLPRFFEVLPIWSTLVIIFTLLTGLLFGIMVLQSLVNKKRVTAILLSLYIVCLAPFIFLPAHKFTLELTLPMVFFSLVLGYLLNIVVGRKILVIFLLVYLTFNLMTNYLYSMTHYSVTRSKISRNVVNYFQKNYPSPDKNQYFEFINDEAVIVEELGYSKQIAHATSRSDLFKVIYQDANYEVFFEDLVAARPDKKRVPIPSSIFFKD